MALDSCGNEIGRGSTLERETAPGSGVFVAIAGMSEFPEPSFTAETGECTDFDSVGGWKEYYKNGTFDAGQLALTMFWRSGDAQQSQLYQDFLGLDAQNYRIVWSDALNTTMTFAGLLIGWGRNTQIAEAITQPLNFQITGEPQIVPA